MPSEDYLKITTSDGPGWILASRLDRLREVDAIVFDCDGVLIDTRRSYDAAIAEVTDRLLRSMAGVRLPWKNLAPPLTLLLRHTGGFNNDWDSVYALVLFSVLALPQTWIRNISDGNSSQSRKADIILSGGNLRTLTKGITALAQRFSSRVRLSGSEAAYRFAQAEASSSAHASAVARVRHVLGYPGKPPKSLLATIFDETYLGARLFRRLYGVEAQHNRGQGFIEREKVLLSRSNLENLSKLLGSRKLAISTGRPYLAAKYVLRDLMTYFDRNASTFIGDADSNPKLAPRLSRYKKPSELSLLHARRKLGSSMLLYAGDSAEDAKMIERAWRSKQPVAFAGIYGAHYHGEGQARFFQSCKADVILPRARQVAAILCGSYRSPVLDL